MPAEIWTRIVPAARTILLAWLFAAAGASRAEAPDLSGWWQARIEGHGEHALLYLHLDRENDRNRARLSIPMVRTYEAGIGAYQIDGDTLRFTNIGWAMH